MRGVEPFINPNLFKKNMAILTETYKDYKITIQKEKNPMDPRDTGTLESDPIFQQWKDGKVATYTVTDSKGREIETFRNVYPDEEDGCSYNYACREAKWFIDRLLAGCYGDEHDEPPKNIILWMLITLFLMLLGVMALGVYIFVTFVTDTHAAVFGSLLVVGSLPMTANVLFKLLSTGRASKV